MLRGEQRYYNDSEVLHYEVQLRSSSSSSSSASAKFRITQTGANIREVQRGGAYRIIESSSSSSSESASSSSFSTPFRYQNGGDDLCDIVHNLDC